MVVGRLWKWDSRILIVAGAVEAVQILAERGAAVLQANHTRKSLVLADVHMSIGGDGARTGRVPRVAVEVVAGRAEESGCVDPVTEMFVDRAARDLLHSDLGQRVEECVNLRRNQLSIRIVCIYSD